MISFILNAPYTFFGLMVGIISLPKNIEWRKKSHAIIVNVSKLWWAFGYMKGASAVIVGHVILLGPTIEDKDLEHELVHIQQYDRLPLIYPVLYYIELIRKGYKNNAYEIEAYRLAGNIYKEK